MQHKRVRLLAASLILFLTTLCSAQSDNHVADDPAKDLFARSAWAHGYIHGYEMGFHEGNLDLHLGRPTRDPHKVKSYKMSKREYEPAFGSKKQFSRGYGSGFEVGYSDAMTGHAYRAASMANSLTGEVGKIALTKPNEQVQMDDTIASGYADGRTTGLRMGRTSPRGDANAAEKGSEECPRTAAANQLCEAYTLGYKWGFSDGFANQSRDEATRTARK